VNGPLNMHTELQPVRSRGAPACRDTANQLNAIRRIVANVAAAMPPAAVANIDTPMAFARKSEDHCVRLYDPVELQDRLLWASGLVGETKQAVVANLKAAQTLGPMRRVAAPPNISAIDDLARDFPHCSEVTALLRRRVALAYCCSTPTFRLPPLLLSGTPGCGKTALAKRIAKMLAVPHAEIDMSTLHTSFSVVGLDVGYATGRPGRLWEVLQHECMSPVVVLDELDKAQSGRSDDVVGFLYALLEPVTARRFSDAAIGLAIDASKVNWIATCNDLRAIDAAILSRFTVIEMPQPKAHEMPAVIASIHNDLLSTAEWIEWFEQPLSTEVVAALASLSPRAVMHAIEDAYANAAAAGRRVVIQEDVSDGRTPHRQHQMGFIHSHNVPGTRT
jgi:MoxR-like ATPase